MSAEQDYKLLEYGIGFTNMVQRATKGSADLTRKEIKDGSRILLDKLRRFRPKIAVFNGKLIFEVFSGKKDFNFGKQPECVEGTDTYVWVVPSSSARCAQLPRAADKVPFYMALKKFRDYLNGIILHMDESQCIFTEKKIKQFCGNKNEKELIAGCNRVVLCGDKKSPEIPITVNGMEIDCNKIQMQPIEDYTGKCILTQHQRPDVVSIDNGKGCGGAVRRIAMSKEGIARSKANCAKLPEQDKFSTFLGRSIEAIYMHRPDESIHSHSHAPDQRASQSMETGQQHNNDDFMMASYHRQPLPEKKKRGRPKKIKEQDMLGQVTCNRLQVMGQIPLKNDFSNILSLTIMSESIAGTCVTDSNAGIGFGSSEASKKKRGRPKKLKPSTEVQQRHNALMQHTGPQLMSIQELTNIDNNLPPHMQKLSQETQKMYTSSPTRSPQLNCSYAGITPPTSIQSTPPTQQNDNLVDNNGVIGSPRNRVTVHIGNDGCDVERNSANAFYATKNIPHGVGLNCSEHHGNLRASKPFTTSSSKFRNKISASNDPYLGESSPPTSPKICSVYFEPPAALTAHSSGHDSEKRNQRQSALHEEARQLPQNTRYTSPMVESSADHQLTTDHYQKLLSLHAQYVHTHQQQPKTEQHHHNQHFQNIINAHSLQEPTTSVTIHDQWQVENSNDGGANCRLSSTPTEKLQINHLHQQTQQIPQHNHLINDLSCKSLSGLESLVDQIPSMPENESISLTAGNNSCNAAVERLSQRYHQSQNMQHDQHHTHININNSTFNMNSEHYCTHNTTLNGNNNSSSNTPLPVTGLFNTNSPDSYSIHTLHPSVTASPVMMPERIHHQSHHHQQQQQMTSLQHCGSSLSTSVIGDVLLPSKPLDSSARCRNSAADAASRTEDISHACTPPVTCAVSITTNSLYNIPTSMHYIGSYQNLSVSNLDTTTSYASFPTVSSATAVSNVYHHSNFMAAAALAAAAANSSVTHIPVPCIHTQMYMEPHRHLTPHTCSVNTMYGHHMSAHHHHSAYSTAPLQHTSTNDYNDPYCTPNFSGAAQASSLQFQSPNYPYRYGSQDAAAVVTAVAQSSYTSAMHGTRHHQLPEAKPSPQPPGTAAATAVYHAHPHATHLHPHSLSMLSRLKPSDISGYSGF